MARIRSSCREEGDAEVRVVWCRAVLDECPGDGDERAKRGFGWLARPFSDGPVSVRVTTPLWPGMVPVVLVLAVVADEFLRCVLPQVGAGDLDCPVKPERFRPAGAIFPRTFQCGVHPADEFPGLLGGQAGGTIVAQRFSGLAISLVGTQLFQGTVAFLITAPGKSPES
jgi:hypothetical protein